MIELPTILKNSDIDRNFPDFYAPSESSDERQKRQQEEKEGKPVRIIGRYTQVDVSKPRKKTTPIDKSQIRFKIDIPNQQMRREQSALPPQYVGHVAIILAEGTAEKVGVLLYPPWHPKAIRPAAEIARYNNRMVVVVGKLVSRTPQAPDFRAHPIGPCLLTIDSLDFLPQE